MLNRTVTSEASSDRALDEHVRLFVRPPAQAELNRRSEDIARRQPEMKWITTERGLEVRWVVRPEEPAHFVLRDGRIVPAA